MRARLVMVLETKLHMHAYANSPSLVSEVRTEYSGGSQTKFDAGRTTGVLSIPLVRNGELQSMIFCKLSLVTIKTSYSHPSLMCRTLEMRQLIDLALVRDSFILHKPPSAHSPSLSPSQAAAPSSHARSMPY